MVEKSKDDKIECYTANPYNIGQVYKRMLKRSIGFENFELLMGRYAKWVLGSPNMNENWFVIRFGEECLPILNKLRSIGENHTQTIRKIRQDFGSKCYYNNTYRVEELALIEDLREPLKLMEAIYLRQYVTSFSKSDAEQRDCLFKVFKMFSYNVIYALEIRKLFIKANYDLSRVDTTVINCDTSCDNPAEMQSMYLPMIRDFELIFT